MCRRLLHRCLIALALVCLATATVPGQAGPKVLLVVAHPDDEIVAAGTIYRLTQERGGTVDQFVITNGEGGYRYSTLAERIYGLKLTDEQVGRRELPDIRKRELLAAGRILGVRAHFFLDEPDIDNTDDPADVLDGTWDVSAVLGRLDTVLRREQYDYVLVTLPRDGTGGHHLAATILALRAVRALDGVPAPVVFGVHFVAEPFVAEGDSLAAGFSGTPDFTFDREQHFGFNDALDYRIIANWVIAEHKSQGLYQTNVNRQRHEYYWVYNKDVPDVRTRAGELFAVIEGAPVP